MKLETTTPPRKRFNAKLVPAPSDIPGNLAIKRMDTEELIPLREIMGVPNAPGSTVKYQLLEVTGEEKALFEKEGIILASGPEDLKKWYDNWDGPKPGKA